MPGAGEAEALGDSAPQACFTTQSPLIGAIQKNIIRVIRHDQKYWSVHTVQDNALNLLVRKPVMIDT